MNNQIKVKLTAYTKYVQPDLSDYVLDTPDDGKTYARKHKQWVDISDIRERTKVAITENSGLDLIYLPEQYTYILKVRKEDLLQTQLPSILEDDTVYYIASCSAEEYICGGTVFSDGHNEYVYESEYEDTLDGGTAVLEDVEIIYGLNSKGVCDESTN